MPEEEKPGTQETEPLEGEVREADSSKSDKKAEESKPSTPFAQAVARIDEARWMLYQNLGGAALGLAAGLILFFVKSDGSFLPLNFVVALAVAKFLPDYVEKQGGRSLRRARIAMILAMLASMLAYLVYMWLALGPEAFIFKKQ